MGQVLSYVQDEAKKKSDEAEKTASDALTALVDLAKLQTVVFKARVK